MKYSVKSDCVEVEKSLDFDAKEIFTCGQVFRFLKPSENSKNGWQIFFGDDYAEVVETDRKICIVTSNPKKAVEYFDLDRDYSKLKMKYAGDEIIQRGIKAGSGIRILKQDFLEALISFIVSANNNIKRISKTLFRLCESYGKRLAKSEGDNYYAFPTLEELSKVSEAEFKELGCGYRSIYLVKTIKVLIETDFLDRIEKMRNEAALTSEIREELLLLCGVGRKVADCVLLFGLNRFDVFPVDTWVEKIYNNFYIDENDGQQLNREKIADFFVEKFKEDSGIVQQYLFNYMLNNKTL